jgi:putative membrane protein
VAVSAAWASLLAGLPVLLVHLAVTTGLLLGGVALYVRLAPYHELECIRAGNPAAAIVLSGQTLGLAIPLAAMLASSVDVADIVLWGFVTIILQFIAIVAVRLSIHHLPALIKRGEIAPALVLGCAQIAAGILNAAAMSR